MALKRKRNQAGGLRRSMQQRRAPQPGQGPQSERPERFTNPSARNAAMRGTRGGIVPPSGPAPQTPDWRNQWRDRIRPQPSPLPPKPGGNPGPQGPRPPITPDLPQYAAPTGMPEEAGYYWDGGEWKEDPRLAALGITSATTGWQNVMNNSLRAGQHEGAGLDRKQFRDALRQQGLLDNFRQHRRQNDLRGAGNFDNALLDFGQKRADAGRTPEGPGYAVYGNRNTSMRGAENPADPAWYKEAIALDQFDRDAPWSGHHTPLGGLPPRGAPGGGPLEGQPQFPPGPRPPIQMPPDGTPGPGNGGINPGGQPLPQPGAPGGGPLEGQQPLPSPGHPSNGGINPGGPTPITPGQGHQPPAQMQPAPQPLQQPPTQLYPQQGQAPVQAFPTPAQQAPTQGPYQPMPLPNPGFPMQPTAPGGGAFEGPQQGMPAVPPQMQPVPYQQQAPQPQAQMQPQMQAQAPPQQAPSFNSAPAPAQALEQTTFGPGGDQPDNVPFVQQASAQTQQAMAQAQNADLGLPLSPEFEGARRALEDEFAATLMAIGVERDQIPMMVKLATERLATAERGDLRQTDNASVSRGLFDSGIRNSDRRQVNQGFDRQRQDLAFDAAGQYSDLAGRESEARSGYGKSLADLWLQLANQEAQDPRSAAPKGDGKSDDRVTDPTKPPRKPPKKRRRRKKGRN